MNAPRYGGLGAFAPPEGWNPPPGTPGAPGRGLANCGHGVPLAKPCWACAQECAAHPSPFPHMTYTRVLSRRAVYR